MRSRLWTGTVLLCCSVLHFCGAFEYPENIDAPLVIEKANGAIGGVRGRHLQSDQDDVPAWRQEKNLLYIKAVDAAAYIPSEPIVLIKATKTGGSTASGIFRQFAERTGVRSCDLPWEGGANLDREIFEKYCLVDGKAPVMETHQVGTTTPTDFLEEYMPGHRRFIIVRNPVDRARSGFNHAAKWHEKVLVRGDPKEQFCALYAEPGKELEYLDACPRFVSSSQTQGAKYGDRTSLGDVIRGYDLVLLTDRFDESAVMLRRTLGMSFLDILYFRAKSGHSTNDESRSNLQSDAFVAKVLAGAHQDWDLWALAALRLSQAIEAAGEEWDQEMEIYLSMKAEAQAYCEEQKEAGEYSKLGEWYLYRDEGGGWNCFKEWYLREVNPWLFVASTDRAIDPCAVTPGMAAHPELFGFTREELGLSRPPAKVLPNQ